MRFFSATKFRDQAVLFFCNCNGNKLIPASQIGRKLCSAAEFLEKAFSFSSLLHIRSFEWRYSHKKLDGKQQPSKSQGVQSVAHWNSGVFVWGRIFFLLFYFYFLSVCLHFALVQLGFSCVFIKYTLGSVCTHLCITTKLKSFLVSGKWTKKKKKMNEVQSSIWRKKSEFS